jgi:K+-sensing histidine kinase KdpD
VFLITVLDLTLTRERSYLKIYKNGQLGTSNEGSTGIGLYLCRKLKNQGQLTAVSGQNKGAILQYRSKE